MAGEQGLFFHWLSVFGLKLLGLGNDWEEKKIKEFMNQK
ncbi:2TM domain-containing protein [Polaribacter sejongensis]